MFVRVLSQGQWRWRCRGIVCVERSMATSRQRRSAAGAKKGCNENQGKSKSNDFEESRAAPRSLINVSNASSSTLTSSSKEEEPAKYADESGVSKVDPSEILDMPSLYNPNLHLPNKPNFAALSHVYESGTPLGDKLEAYIGIRGPITVAEYMNFVLGDEELGYYSNPTASNFTNHLDHNDNDEDDDEDDWDDDWDKDDHDDLIKSSQEGVIGAKGDFTTAPEISQIFGESLLIFLITQWKDLGKPDAIQLIELGPGRGTLMADVLRTAINNFPHFAKALANGGGVHLVELVGGLRAKQKQTLQQLITDVQLQQQNQQQHSDQTWSFKFLDENNNHHHTTTNHEEDDTDKMEKNNNHTITIQWHSHFSEIPSPHLEHQLQQYRHQQQKKQTNHDTNDNKSTIISSTNRTAKEQLQSTPLSSSSSAAATTTTTTTNTTPSYYKPTPAFILCQEMIDALPIHSFQKTNEGVWRERLVDVAMKEEEEEHDDNDTSSSCPIKKNQHERKGYQTVTEEEPTKNQQQQTSSIHQKNTKKPRFRFVLPPDTTPALRTLLNIDHKTGRTQSSITYLDDATPGDIIEVNPDGLMLAQDIASFLEYNHGGAALIVDYGEDGSGGDTLRGFRRHRQCHPLSLPGWVDVTADVDFGALKMAVNNQSSVAVVDTATTTTTTTTDNNNNNKEPPIKPKKDPIMAFGPVSHCNFLASMGAPDRVVKLIEQEDTTDEQAQDLFDALERLMHPDQMGERYKVLAIGRKKDGIFHPPGF